MIINARWERSGTYLGQKKRIARISSAERREMELSWHTLP